MTKSELLTWLHSEIQQWQTLLDEIGPARMAQPGVNGEWAMKDMIGHLTGWNRHLATRFAAALRGEPEPTPPWPAMLETDDEINAWIYEAYRARALQEVLDETDHVNQQLFALVQDLPDDARLEHIDPNFYLVWVNEQRFIPGEFFNHFHDDHEADVRTWLARQETQ